MLRRLHDREMSDQAARRFRRRSGRERFSNFKLRTTHDTHDYGAAHLKLSFLRRRSKIVELVSSGDVVFALTFSGVAVAYKASSGERLAFLNTSADEVIRSLFFNKANASLITVSVYRADNFSSLHCRSTPLEYIRRGMPDAGFALFEGESLTWPGFIDFDDVNNKVLTYSAQDKTYCVWDMKNYVELYRIPDEKIAEIKISPGIMLLIFERDHAGFVPLKLVSIEDGHVVKQFTHLLHRTKKIDFIEQFNEYLLVKQENECMQIVNVYTSTIIHVLATECLTPATFIFLYENSLFLTVRNRTVTVWNFRGEPVTEFEDHTLWHPDTNTNSIYITSAQDYIVSYCRTKGDAAHSGGTINVSHILTGKCVAKIAEGVSLGTLQDVTSLYFNEERHELYVGNRSGMLHVLAQ